MSLFRRIANLFVRSNIDREIEAELRSHIEMRIADNIAAGMTPRAARRDALVRFGNRAATREKVARADAALAIDSLWFDLRYALRQLRRNPGFAASAIAVFALGICASVSIFAFVDAVLLRPLPYHDPAQLMGLFESNPLGPRFHLSYLDYLDWKRMNHTFAALEIYDGGDSTLRIPSGVEDVGIGSVSAGFFRMLGVTPALGRGFREGEDRPGAPGVALLSYAAWQIRYGGRADILGQSIVLDNEPRQIVGVLPKDFYFSPTAHAEFWRPIEGADHPEDRGEHNLSGLGRLKPGTSVEQAQADMSNIAALIAKQYPGYDEGRGATVMPWTEVTIGRLRSVLNLLMCGAVLLLLIAAVNVSGLLLVRSENRRREIAVRSALGAPRARLIRFFVLEGVLLSASAAGLGLAGSYGLMHVLIRLLPEGMTNSMPYLSGLGLNAHVLIFAGGVALLTAALFALAPLFQLSGDDLRNRLEQGGRTAAGSVWRHLGANLVIFELCTAMVLLSGAGLLGRSFYRLMHSDLGIETGHLAILRITPSDSEVYAKPYQQVAFAHQLIDNVSHLPGVVSASVAHHIPLAGVTGNNSTGVAAGSTNFTIAGRPPHPAEYEANFRQVGAGFFSTLHARLNRGRYFSAGDDIHHPPVMIVNQAFAHAFFPGQNPLGQHIGYDQSKPSSEIVGVIDNIKEGTMDSQVGPAMYTAFDQVPDSTFYLVARTSDDPRTVLTALEQSVHQLDPAYIIQVRQTMEERIQDSQAAYLHRASAWIVSGFAAMALLLGIVGLYGVIAYSVSRRTREIGVRMALGAQRSSVHAMVMSEAGRLIVVGIAAGLICSVAAASVMRSMLFDTAPWDALTLSAVAVVLALSAALASYVPARRAASVNPVEALRAE
ncbi:MAG TPA: ABC transporter permease [Acidobacteriaceae bacterium]|jgi:predicted permease|nr:ABC transporter permease [Acidobacteriaceae bacterium]